MTRKNIMFTALSAAFVAAAGLASPAFALEPKQCLPMAEMNAALKAEGQRTMILGDRITVNDDASRASGVKFKRYANAVTANADGSVGYQLEGDLPRAQASNTMCVAAKLTNVKLYDARQPGTPKGVLLGGAFDETIRANEKIGTRPMAQADTVFPNADGSYHLGQKLTVLGNMEVKGGYLLARDAKGYTVKLATMGDTDYTPTALQRLSAFTQVAMRSPN